MIDKINCHGVQQLTNVLQNQFYRIYVYHFIKIIQLNGLNNKFDLN